MLHRYSKATKLQQHFRIEPEIPQEKFVEDNVSDECYTVIILYNKATVLQQHFRIGPEIPQEKFVEDNVLGECYTVTILF